MRRIVAAKFAVAATPPPSPRFPLLSPSASLWPRWGQAKKIKRNFCAQNALPSFSLLRRSNNNHCGRGAWQGAGQAEVTETRLEAINGLNQKSIFQKKLPNTKATQNGVAAGNNCLRWGVCVRKKGSVCLCECVYCVCVCLLRVCAAACINMSTATASAPDSFSHLTTLLFAFRLSILLPLFITYLYSSLSLFCTLRRQPQLTLRLQAAALFN